jgi:hypothetical protein
MGWRVLGSSPSEGAIFRSSIDWFWDTASSKMLPGLIPEGKRGQSVAVTTNPQLEPRLKKA